MKHKGKKGSQLFILVVAFLGLKTKQDSSREKKKKKKRNRFGLISQLLQIFIIWGTRLQFVDKSQTCTYSQPHKPQRQGTSGPAPFGPVTKRDL